MEKAIYYKVYAIRRDGRKDWIATYSNPDEAHDAAQRYNAPYTIIQIEKVSLDKYYMNS